jgi:hypothetical protein
MDVSRAQVSRTLILTRNPNLKTLTCYLQSTFATGRRILDGTGADTTPGVHGHPRSLPDAPFCVEPLLHVRAHMFQQSEWMGGCRVLQGDLRGLLRWPVLRGGAGGLPS